MIYEILYFMQRRKSGRKIRTVIKKLTEKQKIILERRRINAWINGKYKEIDKIRQKGFSKCV